MYCGIDVSKGKSNVCILDNNKLVVEEFEIKHNKEGFAELENHLKPGIKIGMETTGNYCKTLYNYLKSKYAVCYVDNAQMKVFSKLKNPDKKNDKIDARLIALYLASDFKRIDATRMNELKDLSRLYQKTIKQLTRYKFMFKDQINIIFPEMDQEFELSTGKTIQYLMLKYPGPELIKELSYDEIEQAMTENLSKHGSLTYKDKTLKKIKELAQISVGIKDYPTTCFQETVKMLLFHQEAINNLKKKLEESLKKTPYYKVIDEFGYNIVSLSTIVGEVGDIRRFPTHKHFASYCGFDISEKQSGSYQSHSCYITKRGNRILRCAFYNLVPVHLRYKTELSKFFYRLRDEKGKHAKKCMIATARKLAVQTYYHMLRCHETKDLYSN